MLMINLFLRIRDGMFPSFEVFEAVAKGRVLVIAIDIFQAVGSWPLGPYVQAHTVLESIYHA